MEITGRFIQKLEEQSGTTARGEWKRGGFVMETEGEYPKKIAINAFGEDRLAMINDLKSGDPIKVFFSVESREYPQGSNKWFTNCNLIRVTNPYANSQATQAAFATAPMPSTAIPQPQAQTAQVTSNDDLPF